MVFMIFLDITVDGNVIDEYYYEIVKVFTEDINNEIHKNSRCIGETK